jgi:lysine 2,3-aminomutase
MERDIWLSEEEEPPSTDAGTPDADFIGRRSPQVIPFRLTRPPVVKRAVSTRNRQFAIVPSDRTAAFMERFFPEATPYEWNDWRWQIRHSIRNLAQLERIVALSPAERDAILSLNGALPLRITPYYASLLDPLDPAQPIRRSVIPVSAEFNVSPGEAADPLGEDHDSPVPGLVHRYPDRVLFLTTGFCAAFCRYCTRSRMVGHSSHGAGCSKTRWQKALDYIAATPTVRDVLLSGGDPLTLSNEQLSWLLTRLRQIPHVEFIRLGTKVPVVMPQRVTPSLVRMLRQHHPLFMSIHFTHPDELTPETVQACERLADAGIPLGSQTVLLAGINDDVDTMKRLLHGLLRARVRPYYLYQCDPIRGSGHFRTPVARGLEIIRGLRGHTSGYAVPTYVIDAPGGGGKIPLLPDYLQGRDGDDVILKNFEDRLFRYPDPAGAES